MPHISKIKKALKPNSLTEAEMIAQVKKAEKGKMIPYNEFVKITEKWKDENLRLLK
jgi:hypothetical protein